MDDQVNKMIPKNTLPPNKPISGKRKHGNGSIYGNITGVAKTVTRQDLLNTFNGKVFQMNCSIINDVRNVIKMP